MSADSSQRRLLRPISRERDHVRGGDTPSTKMTIVIYGDFLCPYCRRLRQVLLHVRRALGERMVYVFLGISPMNEHIRALNLLPSRLKPQPTKDTFGKRTMPSYYGYQRK